MEKKTLDNHALPNLIKESIIDEIMQGKIKSGDKLVEAKYSDMFGTSRAPVREAFYLLNLEGYVQKIPRKGTVVKGFTAEEMRDILEIRNFLELLSIDRMNAESQRSCLEQMGRIILEMGREGLDTKSYAKLNYDFHFQLILASQSEIIQNAYSRLASPLMSLQAIAFMKNEAIRNSLIEHRQIVALLAEERFEEAKALLNSHNQGVFPRVREMKGI